MLAFKFSLWTLVPVFLWLSNLLFFIVCPLTGTTSTCRSDTYLISVKFEGRETVSFCFAAFIAVGQLLAHMMLRWALTRILHLSPRCWSSSSFCELLRDWYEGADSVVLRTAWRHQGLIQHGHRACPCIEALTKSNLLCHLSFGMQ